MNLLEFEGKKLLQKYSITVPASQLLKKNSLATNLDLPLVLKVQVPVGDRKKKGGILFVDRKSELKKALDQLWQIKIDGHQVQQILVEEKVEASQEIYLSFSYDTASRHPVLALNKQGGTGIDKASLTIIDPLWGLPSFLIRQALLEAKLNLSRNFQQVIQSLWRLFSQEKALLAEINPLFIDSEGQCIAGDAKIILDDHVVRPDFRPYLELGGDIAVLASGGGASMVNLDALLRHKGRPANYVEYSGNPKSGIVADLTQKVLSRPDLKGCWVVGGTANFTDIFETMTGFVEGLKRIKPKPTYPIVIRRDGPRQKEAFDMLRQEAQKERFNFYLFGPKTSMSKSAQIMTKLAYEHSD